MNEEDIAELVKADAWMMEVLYEAEKLRLPDWMIGAGFLRNKVWDHLHDIRREVADTNDIDLVYFDANNADEEHDKALSTIMNGKLGLEWEIKNQAYMHTRHGDAPYTSTQEGISHWVETPTCVAVTLKDNQPIIIAPHGIEDLVSLIIRPSPSTKEKRMDYFYERITKKSWLQKWPKLQVVID